MGLIFNEGEHLLVISKSAKFNLDETKDEYEQNLEKLENLKLEKLCKEKNKNDLKNGQTMTDLLPITLHINESMLMSDKLEQMRNKENTKNKIKKEITIKKLQPLSVHPQTFGKMNTALVKKVFDTDKFKLALETDHEQADEQTQRDRVDQVLEIENLYEKKYMIVKSEDDIEKLAAQSKYEVLLENNNLENEVEGEILKLSIQKSGMVEIHCKSNTRMRQTKYKYLHSPCIPKKKIASKNSKINKSEDEKKLKIQPKNSRKRKKRKSSIGVPK